MTMALIAGQTTINEALESNSCRLVACDNAVDTLAFNQLLVDIQNTTGMNIQTAAGDSSLHGAFNQKTAGFEQPAGIAPDHQPERAPAPEEALRFS